MVKFIVLALPSYVISPPPIGYNEVASLSLYDLPVGDGGSSQNRSMLLGHVCPLSKYSVIKVPLSYPPLAVET